MALFVCDLHVHIGKSASGRAVKITAASDLTIENIAIECASRKGVEIVGIVDCASPPVVADIQALMDSGEMVELSGGGLRFQDTITVILGAELETREPGGGLSHHVSYLPTLRALRAFSEAIAGRVTNLELSSQQCRMSARELLALALEHEALFVPAHCFTPHKSIYGACGRRAAEVFGADWRHVRAIELGLSADTGLADRFDELADRAFLSNSDAHSLPRIGREYNILDIQEPSFEELALALRSQAGRRIAANFGLDPRLGKYHRTACEACGFIAVGEPPVSRCERCDSPKVTLGVLDRITQIADHSEPRHPQHRPPYQYQVPLQFVPGVGSACLNRLINTFGSEMAVLHQATEREIGQAVGAKIAERIVMAREGRLPLRAGGGGRYGRAVARDTGAVRLPGV